MGYEIEFIGVNEELKDADAICMRWEKENGQYTIGVFDGGFKVHGEALKNHIQKYYFDNNDDGVIDFVICSHSDQDHVCGLKEVLENFEVKALYMNRPWIYVDDLYDKVSDGRITKVSLEKQLREKYPYIAELEEVAIEKKVEIYDIFQGEIICDRLEVLTPQKEFYLELLVESNKTPLAEKTSLSTKISKAFSEIIYALKESWDDEKLREDVETSSENEMSTVILGKMDNENFLLTGDVGIRGLKKAIEYSEWIGLPLKTNVSVYQIPHHGGRHNVSPSILNELIGEVVSEGEVTNKKAFVCVGKNSERPKKMVVNGFIRRGSKVYKASGKTIRHSIDMGDRAGWSKVENLKFSTEVEEWD